MRKRQLRTERFQLLDGMIHCDLLLDRQPISLSKRLIEIPGRPHSQTISYVVWVVDTDLSHLRVRGLRPHCGALRATGELERIAAALGRHGHAGGDAVSVGEPAAESAPALGAVAAVAAWWERLDLGVVLGGGQVADAVFAMVASRLVAPSSKRRVPEWAATDVSMPGWFSHPPLQRYYRAVDVVAGRRIWGPGSRRSRVG